MDEPSPYRNESNSNAAGRIHVFNALARTLFD